MCLTGDIFQLKLGPSDEADNKRPSLWVSLNMCGREGEGEGEGERWRWRVGGEVAEEGAVVMEGGKVGRGGDGGGRERGG